MRNIIYLFGLLLLCQSNSIVAQPKHIREELKRAENYEWRKKLDTYHVLEKYLNNQQRYDLNMYYVGVHVKIPNENKNNFWLYNSAKDGNICAQINLAYSYKVGRIVDKDANKCKKWLLEAIKSKSDIANYYYALCMMDNTFDTHLSDSTIHYLLEAEKRKIEDATLALAYVYKYGMGTAKSDSTANYYFEKYIQDKKQTNIGFSLSNSIFVPNGFDINSLLQIQLLELTTQLQKDTQSVVIIKTNGSSSYQSQQLSWNKAKTIRGYFIAKGIVPERISLNVCGYLHTSIVEVSMATRDEEFVNHHPPPPFPKHGHTIFLKCDNKDVNDHYHH